MPPEPQVGGNDKPNWLSGMMICAGKAFWYMLCARELDKSKQQAMLAAAPADAGVQPCMWVSVQHHTHSPQAALASARLHHTHTQVQRPSVQHWPSEYAAIGSALGEGALQAPCIRQTCPREVGLRQDGHLQLGP